MADLQKDKAPLQEVGQVAKGTASTAANVATKAATRRIASKFMSSAMGKAVAAGVSKLGAALGSFVGPIGTVIGNIGGAFIAKHAKKLIIGATAAIGGMALGAATLILAPFVLFFGMLGAAAAAVFITAFAALAILAVLIPLILFIINSGGYIVPPGDDFIINPDLVSQDCPEGGPAGWPVDLSENQSYFISQGPFTNNSHTGLEAIDVTVTGAVRPNYRVIATHTGTIRSAGIDSYGGLFVDIGGRCSNGVEFRTRHVHFTSINPAIWDPINRRTNRITVQRGFLLGIVGDTGYANLPHDHYEFRAIDRWDGNNFANSPFLMEQPFIPVSIPRGCIEGITIPCGVRLP